MKETLARIALRLSDREYDPRHAILDVSAELLPLEESSASLPPDLRIEFRELLKEVRSVQPAFPSRRATSSLFDRAGMGQAGRDRAMRLVQRLKALAAAIEQAKSRR